jgi:hypothetical protein
LNFRRKYVNYFWNIGISSVVDSLRGRSSLLTTSIL